MNSSLVLEVLILQVSLPICCEIAINNLGKQLTNSRACGYNTGQWTRVQITDIQMSPSAMSSSSTAKTPFSITHCWIGDALSWLFQSLHSPCPRDVVGNGEHQAVAIGKEKQGCGGSLPLAAA